MFLRVLYVYVTENGQDPFKGFRIKHAHYKKGVKTNKIIKYNFTSIYNCASKCYNNHSYVHMRTI